MLQHSLKCYCMSSYVPSRHDVAILVRRQHTFTRSQIIPLLQLDNYVRRLEATLPDMSGVHTGAIVLAF